MHVAFIGIAWAAYSYVKSHLSGGLFGAVSGMLAAGGAKAAFIYQAIWQLIKGLEHAWKDPD